MKEIVETEVNKLTYRVVDKNTGQIIDILDDLKGIESYIREYAKENYGITISYNSPNLLEPDRTLHKLEFKKQIRTEVDYDVEATGERRWYSVRPYPKTRVVYEFKYCYGFFIENELGDLVDPKEIPRTYRSRRFSEHEEKLQELIGNNLIKKKKNLNKIKDSYQTCYSSYSGYAYQLHAGNRSVKTTQALKHCANVCKEDGEPEFRGKRKNIPSTWDDIQSDVYNTHKSWKHNSKRRKQWKAKPST